MENIKYIGILIKRIDDAIAKIANKELEEKDVTFSQMHMLWTLKDAKDGILTLKELEKSLRLAQPTTLGIAKRLEGKGFVEGSFDNADKRTKYIKIAPKGKEICRSSRAHMDETEGRLLKGLSKGDRALLYELLLKLSKNMET
ncbi:MAG TPA: MarR family transcriptional regulator [Acidobacteriota bacterium]|nr:MarR family transcriptional regulator [Acidobacteriota bacterium]